MSFTYLDDAPASAATTQATPQAAGAPQPTATPQTSGKFTYLDGGDTTPVAQPLSPAKPGMIDMRADTQGINTPDAMKDVMGVVSNPIGAVSKAFTGKTLADNIGGPDQDTSKMSVPEMLGYNARKALGEATEGAGNLALGGGIAKVAPKVSVFGSQLAKAASELPENINNLASPIRDYAGNKVNAIRSGAKLYWKSEMDAYGQGLDKLSTNPKQVPLNNLMQKATQTMIDRKLYDPVQEKWVNPLTPVDSQLIKSYKQLARNFNNNGTASVGDIVKEYQKIRDSAPLGTSMGKEAKTVASEFLQGASKDIDLPEYKKLNERYSNFKNNFDSIDSKVDVWGNPLKTARGENFLTRGLSKTMEARKAAQTIQAKTGQTLKGAKVLNAVNNLPLAKYIIPH